jgi:hypothetical protein
MIFYEVLGTSEAPCCFVGTQVDAKRLAKERGTSFEQVDVPTDKSGLMDYVNRLKADINAEMHREPTRDEIINSNTPEMQAKAHELMTPGYTEQSVRFEDEFAAMPLGTQLHYAGLALENARDKL